MRDLNEKYGPLDVRSSSLLRSVSFLLLLDVMCHVCCAAFKLDCNSAVMD
jgi:hypothetical protein